MKNTIDQEPGRLVFGPNSTLLSTHVTLGKLVNFSELHFS